MGATSLSESLKSNTTLAKLNLCGGYKRRHTNGIHQQLTLSFLFTSTDNKIGDMGAKSLSESLKSNTSLTKLNLESEDKRKKKDTQMKSTNKIPFLTSQQATRLEKEEQHH